MTWRTAEEDRVLTGAEAILFASVVAAIIDFYDAQGDDNESLNWGQQLIIGRFEELSTPQKFTVLYDIAKALLIDDGSVAPYLNHINEGAVYYVFRWLAVNCEDCYMDDGPLFADIIINAYNQCFPTEVDEDSDDGYRPTLETNEYSVWENAVESLADRILWDRDFEEAQTLEDSSDESSISSSDSDASDDAEPEYFSSKHFNVVPRANAKQRLYQLCNRVMQQAASNVELAIHSECYETAPDSTPSAAE